MHVYAQCAGCWVRNVESADAGKAHVSAMTNQQSGWKASQTQCTACIQYGHGRCGWTVRTRAKYAIRTYTVASIMGRTTAMECGSAIAIRTCWYAACCVG
eukprot:COSAG01_NODE_1241_length_11085_cov_9.712361_1_plen_100_part_00